MTGLLTHISAGGDGGNGDLPGADFVATDPRGRLMYASSGSSLLAFTIDDATGKLTLARSVPTIAQGVGLAWITVDAQARFLVVGGNASLAIHRLDPVSGLPLSTDGGSGGTPYSVSGNNFGGGQSILPSGLAVYHPSASSLSTYAVDPTTLELTFVGGGNATNAIYPLESVTHPSGLTVSRPATASAATSSATEACCRWSRTRSARRSATP